VILLLGYEEARAALVEKSTEDYDKTQCLISCDGVAILDIRHQD